MEYTLYLTFNLPTMCCNIFVWIILSDLYHHCFYFTLLCKFCAQVTHSSEIAFLNMHQVCPTHSPYDQTKKGKVPFELKKKKLLHVVKWNHTIIAVNKNEIFCN